jgi:hypothetical protein
MELVVDNDPTTTVMARTATWPEQARALTIADASGYARARELLLDIKALQHEVDAAFDPIITDANRAHKTACAQKRQAEAPLVEAETILKRGMSAYHVEQERLRQVEQRRLEEEARIAEEARRLEEAAALELEGHRTDNAELVADAHALIAQPITAPPVLAAKTTPKIAGISHRENWGATLLSLRALIRFVAAHPEYENLLSYNVAAGNALARSLKTNLKVDGLRAVNTPNVAASGR